MQDGRTSKLVKAVTAGVAAALLAVPVAQARLAIETNRAAAQDTPSVVRTDPRHAALLNKTPVKVEIVRAEPQSQAVQMHRSPAKLDLPAARTGSPAVSTGMDWTDAGIGAASVLGLALLASGGVLVTRRRLVGA